MDTFALEAAAEGIAAALEVAAGDPAQQRVLRTLAGMVEQMALGRRMVAVRAERLQTLRDELDRLAASLAIEAEQIPA